MGPQLKKFARKEVGVSRQPWVRRLGNHDLKGTGVTPQEEPTIRNTDIDLRVLVDQVIILSEESCALDHGSLDLDHRHLPHRVECGRTGCNPGSHPDDADVLRVRMEQKRQVGRKSLSGHVKVRGAIDLAVCDNVELPIL
jgi:hypothetical protein